MVGTGQKDVVMVLKDVKKADTEVYGDGWF